MGMPRRLGNIAIITAVSVITAVGLWNVFASFMIDMGATTSMAIRSQWLVPLVLFIFTFIILCLYLQPWKPNSKYFRKKEALGMIRKDLSRIKKDLSNIKKDIEKIKGANR